MPFFMVNLRAVLVTYLAYLEDETRSMVMVQMYVSLDVHGLNAGFH